MVIVVPQLQVQLMLMLLRLLLLLLLLPAADLLLMCIENRPSCKGQSAIVVAALFAHLVLPRDVLPVAMGFVLVLGSYHDHTCNRQCLFMALLLLLLLLLDFPLQLQRQHQPLVDSVFCVFAALMQPALPITATTTASTEAGAALMSIQSGLCLPLICVRRLGSAFSVCREQCLGAKRVYSPSLNLSKQWFANSIDCSSLLQWWFTLNRRNL